MGPNSSATAQFSQQRRCFTFALPLVTFAGVKTPPKEPPNKKAKVTPENVAEAGRLMKIWKKREIRGQAAFGETFGIGNQSAVGQFLRGEVPLSLKAAKGFAKGLECQISDFSPRLASLAAWPFELVDQEMYERLSPAAQHAAQLRMMDEITTRTPAAQLANGSAN